MKNKMVDDPNDRSWAEWAIRWQSIVNCSITLIRVY
jgi:hypothetical protein